MVAVARVADPGAILQRRNAKMRIAIAPAVAIWGAITETATRLPGRREWRLRGSRRRCPKDLETPTIMTEHSLLRFSRALHRALDERHLDDLENLIDDDIDWPIYGPVDMFTFLGARHGKAAVMEVCRQIADNVQVRRFERESVMLGENSAASMMRYSLTALDSNRPISLRVAHFARFRDGRLASMRVLVDTFDLVEQALGSPIHLPKIA